MEKFTSRSELKIVHLGSDSSLLSTAVKVNLFWWPNNDVRIKFYAWNLSVLDSVAFLMNSKSFKNRVLG